MLVKAKKSQVEITGIVTCSVAFASCVVSGGSAG